MPTYQPPADFVRDAASLLRFMRSMRGSQDIDRTHRPVTTEFLKYIDDTCNSTSIFIQDLVSTPPDPLLPPSDRQLLLTLRDFWRHIHQFVKPSRDADTLHSPVALVEQLEAHLDKLPDLEGVRLLISHTAELNYFHFPRSVLRQRSDDYTAIVPGSPDFPRKTALIAIPYSQESNLFSNLIICHEIGHFVFEERKLADYLLPHIEVALDKHFPAMASDPDQELNLAWCRQRLWSWAEEIYCDRFAIGLIGPAYSFSYIELFDVIGAAEAKTVTNFFDTHPSDACRFSEHADQLERGGWWPLLDRDGKSYAKLIRDMQEVLAADYTFDSDEKSDLAGKVLQAFLEIKENIAELVNQTFRGRETVFNATVDLACVDAIYKYLSWGVVPATLVQDKQFFKPEPSILINAAYLFYLERVPTLIKRINTTGTDFQEEVSQQEKWGERIEQWTMKALEDLRLPNERKQWAANIPAPQNQGFSIKPDSRGILTAVEMKQRQSLEVEHRQNLTITPVLEENRAYDIDSIDLRLGTHFLFPRVPPRAYYCPDETSRDSFHMRVHVPLGDYLVIPPHSTVLGATLEFIKLPFDVSGEILTKSSVARTFVLIETAPWIHPSYRGCLTLEIANVSDTAILLYPGRKIGQMVLMHVAIIQDEDTPELLDSTYFGPVYPEAPPFNNPEVDLFKIGVPSVMIMGGPQPKSAKKQS